MTRRTDAPARRWCGSAPQSPDLGAFPRKRAALIFAFAIALPGVGGAPTHARQRDAEVVAAERRVVVFAGHTLVVPLAGPGAETAQSGWAPRRAPKVDWGTEKADADLRFFLAVPPSEPVPGWLPPPSAWATEPLSRASTAAARPGFWALVVEAPATLRGRPLRIDSRTVPTVWLDEPPPTTIAARLPPLAASSEAGRALRSVLDASASDPFRRWRAALASERLGAVGGPGELPWPADPGIAALARQNEDRWRAALAALARDDADLGADLLARVASVITTPDGALLPAWSLDEAGLAQLRDDLLDPDSSPNRRAEKARAWLQTDPPAAAWVIDDAGSLDGAGDYALVGVTNLSRSHAVASLALEGEAAKNPTRLDGHASVALRVFFEGVAATGPIGSAVIARVSAWSRPLPIGRSPLHPTPPGLVLGPFLAEWDLASWRAGVPVPVIGERAGVALLSRAPDSRAWNIYVECRFPPGSPPANETVRIHIGPREGASRTIELGPGAASAPPVVMESDRWHSVATLALPDSSERFRIGIERTEDSGRRSAWPRPMMPGQARGPGRALIDVSAWGGLGAAPDR